MEESIMLSQSMDSLNDIDVSESSFSSIDSLRDSIAYVSTVVDLPKALETTTEFDKFGGNDMGISDPLSYVSMNIPRMNKPHLVDIIIDSFCEAKYKLDVNPPSYFSNTHYEYDMIGQLSTHPKVHNPTDLKRQFSSASQIIGLEEHPTSIFTLEHKEFFIACARTDKAGVLDEDTDLVTFIWRFVDISRIGSKAQHFTKFVVYCLCTDEQPADIANMIAVLFDIPTVYSSLWNSPDQKQIITSIEQSETLLLTDLAVAQQALDRVNDRMFSMQHDVGLKNSIWVQRKMLMSNEILNHHKHEIEEEDINCQMLFCFKEFGKGVKEDFKRRAPFYASDWLDGLNFKPIWVAVFLALGILPYVFIFGTSIDHHTDGYMNTWHVLVSSIAGGIFMSIFSPQPMIFLSPSAAFILFLNTAKTLANTVGSELEDIYPLTAIFSSLFLILFALTNISASVKFVTSFSDEIFVVFVAVLFIGDAFKEVLRPESQFIEIACLFVAFLVFVLTFAINRLKLNTLTFSWVRSIASDSAPVISAVGVGLLFYYLFPDVYSELPKYTLSDIKGHSKFISFSHINAKLFFLSLLLGFCGAVLILFEHNITAKLVNGEEMKLRKPCAYHLDILILGILNLFLGIFSMPMVVASKIHTFHHIHSMSVHTFEYDAEGTPNSLCINVQETRMTGLLSHILMVIILLFPSIMNIPTSIFAGVLAFMGVVTLLNTQLVGQLISILWKPENLPPQHWLRNVKRWKVFLIDVLQICCIIAIYFIEHSIIGFMYPIFVVMIVVLYRVLYYFFKTDMIMMEHGVENHTHL